MMIGEEVLGSYPQKDIMPGRRRFTQNDLEYSEGGRVPVNYLQKALHIIATIIDENRQQRVFPPLINMVSHEGR